MIRRILLALLCAGALAASAAADEGHAPEEPPPEQHGVYSWRLGSTWRWELIPDGLLYPLYLADPLRPTMSVTRLSVIDSEIPETGDDRHIFRFGGRVGLVRFAPNDRSAAPTIQLDAEAGWLGEFDNTERQDNVAWEGVYGFYVTAASRMLGMQFGLKHDSSHVGDEYVERTGHERVGYTRQEAALGLAFTPLPTFRVYAEGAYALDVLNPDHQDRLRLQAGAVAEDGHLLFGGKAGLYAALDLKAYEESNWRVDLSLQAGLVFPKPGFAPDWRFALEYRRGRSIFGEFFQYDESYWTFGIWVDF